MTGAHRTPETPEELASQAAARRRRNTWIAVAIVLAGCLALGALIWWQEHRYDDYGENLGCGFTELRGQEDPDCD